MQPRRVIFPDTLPFVFAVGRSALPEATHVSKRPGTLVEGTTYVQYRNDSGGESGLLKTERWGVNVHAPSMRDAFDAARLLQAAFRSSANGAPVVAATGGAGPYEIVDEAGAVDSHAHAYFTFELTVRGSNF